MKGPFNTPYADHCLYFTGENWEFAYWTSTKPEGFGGNDIWPSEKIDGPGKKPRTWALTQTLRLASIIRSRLKMEDRYILLLIEKVVLAVKIFMSAA